MSNVPVEKNRTRMPTSMNALPNMVNIRNFIAEYSRRPLPHIGDEEEHGYEFEFPEQEEQEEI